MRTLPIIATLAAVIASPVGADATAERTSSRQIPPTAIEQIRSCASLLAAADRFSGVLLIEQDGRALLEFEHATPGSGPFAMDTPFNIASATKMFTAIAIGQLAEQLKVRFNDHLGDYLDELPPDLGQVTIAQALTHTGGIGGLTRLTPDLAAVIKNARSARELVPTIAQAGLNFRPGSSTEYSNGGFVLLGAVVEAASGMRFQDYVAKNIVPKANMSATSAAEPATAAVRLSRMAPGAPSGGRARTRMGAASPAGGWFSSARDLANFGKALREHRLVDAQTLGSMLTIRSNQGVPADDSRSLPRRGYGYGFRITQSAGDQIVGHGGGAPGANAEIAISILKGWTIVALSNIDPPAATNLAAFARQVLEGGTGTTAECEKIGSTSGPFDARDDEMREQ